MVRAIAGGVAAHSDHGRDIARTLLAVSKGKVQGYSVKDPEKLNAVAALMKIPAEGREINDIAGDVAQKALDNFNGVVDDELTYVSRAPKKRQEIWRKLKIVPRGVDREVVGACTAPMWVSIRTPTICSIMACAHHWPTAGAEPCWRPTFPTSSSARPSRSFHRLTWASSRRKTSTSSFMGTSRHSPR